MTRTIAIALAISTIAIYARQVLKSRMNAARDEQLQSNTKAKGRFGSAASR